MTVTRGHRHGGENAADLGLDQRGLRGARPRPRRTGGTVVGIVAGKRDAARDLRTDLPGVIGAVLGLGETHVHQTLRDLREIITTLEHDLGPHDAAPEAVIATAGTTGKALSQLDQLLWMVRTRRSGSAKRSRDVRRKQRPTSLHRKTPVRRDYPSRVSTIGRL